MSRSLNKIMLIGNVGNDPDVRRTSSGTPIANMSLATTRKWKDGAGEQKEKTEWHRLTVWGKLVDVVERYVKKGDRLYVEGRIEYSESESDGQKKYWTNVNVFEMVMLGGQRVVVARGVFRATPAPHPRRRSQSRMMSLRRILTTFMCATSSATTRPDTPLAHNLRRRHLMPPHWDTDATARPFPENTR